MNQFGIVVSVAVCLLTGCDRENSDSNKKITKALVDKSAANMIHVQGGEFLMGDFGPLVKEKLPFSIQQDDKHLHKVILSDFAISKFKVTNADYAAYLKSTGKEKPPADIMAKRHPSLLKDDYPVGVTWCRKNRGINCLGKSVCR